jgi:hypothetical protein
MSWRRRKDRINAAAALDAHPRQRKTLAMHAFLAGFTALQILYLALDDLKLNILLSLGLAAGYLYSHNLSPRWRSLTTYIVSGLSALAALYYFNRFVADNSMYGNLLGIMGGLLLVLLSFQAFTTNSHRFSLILCVVFLLFGAVASYDLKFMLLLPLFLTFAGCALYTANQVDVQTQAAESSAGRVVLGAGLTRQFVGVLLRAVGLILALSIIAYISAPHSTQPPRGLILNRASRVEEPPDEEASSGPQQQDKDSSEVGLGDDFDLTDNRELTSSPVPVLKMKSHRVSYLRAQCYDVFTGAGWNKSPLLEPQPGQASEMIPLTRYTGDFDPQAGIAVPLVDFPSPTVLHDMAENLQLTRVDNNVFSKNPGEDVAYDINQQQITLLEEQPPFYFASYQPYRLLNISISDRGRSLDQPLEDLTSTIRPQELSKVHPKGFSYTVYSLEPRVNAKQLGQVYEVGPDPIVSHYTWLPLQAEEWQQHARELGVDPDKVRPISQRFVNFARTNFSAEKVVNGKKVFPSIWDKVQRINDYLVNTGGFNYDRKHQDPPEGMEVTEAFCFKTQQGYCRQFASAMAVLCRLNNIPARVVSGYSPGTYSLAENAYIYHQSNAHAWVEVYFDGYGWVMLDPTPTSRNRLDSPPASQLLASAVDFLQELFVIDPAATQKTMLEALLRVWKMAKDNALPVSVGAFLVVGGSLGIWLIRRRLARRRSGRRIAPENSVVVAYLRAQGLLNQLGFVSETGDTARQLFSAAQERFPWLADPLRGLLPLYERAAYSAAAPDRHEAERAAEYLLQVDALVKEELQARKREKRKG